MRKKSAPEQPKECVKRHFIFIEVPVEIVAPEALPWGESAWWPKRCLMRYKRIHGDGIAVGTRYRLQIRKPLTPSWLVEITRLEDDRLVERTFRSGMFQGREILQVEERANGTRIEYTLFYRIRGLFNRILWPLLYRKQHDADLEMIFKALKDHVERKYRQMQDRPREATA